MKEVWVCRCGAIHESEVLVKQCDCTMDGYTYRYQCLNCGALYAKKIVCCSLFSDNPIKPDKQTLD